MSDLPEDVSESFVRLKEIADDEDVEIDSSFVVGIKSYLQIERVRDLSKVQKAVVALRIGELAIARRATLPGTNVAIRDDVQEVILQLCGDPFGRCYGTALTILEDHVNLGDISFLMD